MINIQEIGKFLLFAGLCLAVLGLVLIFFARIGWIGKLPGDLFVKRDNFTFYFPITTSIIISVVLSLILYFFSRK